MLNKQNDSVGRGSCAVSGFLKDAVHVYNLLSAFHFNFSDVMFTFFYEGF